MHNSALRPVNYIDLTLKIPSLGNFCGVADQFHNLGSQNTADHRSLKFGIHIGLQLFQGHVVLPGNDGHGLADLFLACFHIFIVDHLLDGSLDPDGSFGIASGIFPQLLFRGVHELTVHLQRQALLVKLGSQILDLIGDRPAKLVVTVTGGQGFLFGRGNQQLTPEVLRRVGKENIIILATKDKILKLRGQPLLVDTGDTELDAYLSGYHSVICDYNETIVCKVCPG